MWFRACSPVLLYLLPVSIFGAVPSPPEPDFNRDILPIFQRECVGCHSSALKLGGLVLESYQDLMKGGEQGTPLVAGHADQSLLVRMLEGTAEPRMPLNGQLPAEQIQLVRAWIDASARPPATPAAADDEVPIPKFVPKLTCSRRSRPWPFIPGRGGWRGEVSGRSSFWTWLRIELFTASKAPGTWSEASVSAPKESCWRQEAGLPPGKGRFGYGV